MANGDLFLNIGGIWTYVGNVSNTGSSSGGQAPAIVVVPSSATPVFDGSQGTFFQLTLSTNVTSSTVQNLVPAVTYYFLIIQPPSTAYSFIWPSTFHNSQTVAQIANMSSFQPAVALADNSPLAVGTITYSTPV